MAPLPVLLAVPGDDRDTTRTRHVMVPRNQVATVPDTADLGVALDALSRHPAAGMVLVLGSRVDVVGPEEIEVVAPDRNGNGDGGTQIVGVLSGFDIARVAGERTPGGVGRIFPQGWPTAPTR